MSASCKTSKLKTAALIVSILVGLTIVGGAIGFSIPWLRKSEAAQIYETKIEAERKNAAIQGALDRIEKTQNKILDLLLGTGRVLPE